MQSSKKNELVIDLLKDCIRVFKRKIHIGVRNINF